MLRARFRIASILRDRMRKSRRVYRGFGLAQEHRSVERVSLHGFETGVTNDQGDLLFGRCVGAAGVQDAACIVGTEA